MGRLEGQVAIVTGGASGLGQAVVERFVAEGAKVAVLDRSAERCETIQTLLGDAVYCQGGDVRNMADNEALVSACLQQFGRLDCAIGNAGIWDYNLPLVDIEPGQVQASFHELFDINVMGYIMLAKAAMKPLYESSGSMIFTVSNAGFLPNGGGVMYTATKHAVVGVVRQLAFELAPHIRVNGVAPGAIATRLGGAESLGFKDRVFPGEKMAARATGFVPVGQMPTPAEYAGAYVFFASREDNVPATGTVLNHDGGFNVRGLGNTLRGGDDLGSKLGEGTVN